MPKVLTDDDFKKSGDPDMTDTSDKKSDAAPDDKDAIRADAKVIIDGDKETIVEPDDTETPDDKGGVSDKKDDKEPPPKPSDKKYKYKSQDEAERAYAEAERKMHEATTRASTLEKELSQFKKPVASDTKDPVDAQIEKITDEALDAIYRIPVEYDATGKPTPESLRKRDRESSIIWAKANRKITKIEVDQRDEAKKSESNIASALYKKATDDGLSTDDELDMVGLEYGRTDPSLPAQDRIDAAVSKVRERVSRLREGFVKKQEQDKKDREDLRVLGGGSRTARKVGDDKKDTKPATLSSQLAELNEKRKLRKEDMY